MKRILIATDGSRGGTAAVENGLELARAAGAIATIVYVWRAPPAIVGAPYYQRAVSAELKRARTVIDKAQAHADSAGVESEPVILEGDAAGRVLELARLRGADLIVVGSRPLGTVTKALLGSVSRAIVQHADRPGLVVNDRPETARRAA